MISLCPCCATPDSREHVVADAAGKVWRFEMHRFCGPIILRADGEPKTMQPGSRSRFWPAYQAWRDARRSAA